MMSPSHPVGAAASGEPCEGPMGTELPEGPREGRAGTLRLLSLPSFHICFLSPLSPSGQIGASFRVSLFSKVSFSLRTGLNKGCVRECGSHSVPQKCKHRPPDEISEVLLLGLPVTS